jgi:FKBP-type peptidyl-prolyl cis-trans isomerase FkpA
MSLLQVSGLVLSPLRRTATRGGFLRSLRAWLAIAMVGATAAACTQSVTSPSGEGSFSQTDLVAGTGASAINGSNITVHYTGWLYKETGTDKKGLQFETSAGQDPFLFTLGVGAVIQGWDQGLVGMRVGGVRRLVIPPSLAYGSSRNGVIPPNATLVFEVQLLEVQTQ